MRQTQHTKNQINAIVRTNVKLFGISCICVFAYLVFLGLTATNIVTSRALAKSVEEKKTELATVELDYMSSQNIMALENTSNTDFTSAKNIAYVTVGDTGSRSTVAFAKTIK